LNHLEILELISHGCRIGREVLLVFLLEGLLELFDLVADLIALKIGQPLLIILRQVGGDLIDSILFQNRRGDLGDGVANARLISLG